MNALLQKPLFQKCFFGKNASAECYLIHDKGKIIGMCKLLTVMDTYNGIPYFTLRDFIVRRKYQGRGHGKKFLKFVIDLAQERGYSGVQWNVLSWNKSAIAFYKKAGATIAETVRMQIDAH